jgi:hypothetical protein
MDQISAALEDRLWWPHVLKGVVRLGAVQELPDPHGAGLVLPAHQVGDELFHMVGLDERRRVGGGQLARAMHRRRRERAA